MTNYLIEFMQRKLHVRGTRARYEDFVESPQKTFTQMGDMLGYDLAELGVGLRSGKEMIVRHTVAGNRMRMSKVIRLSPDYEWKIRLSQYDRIIFWFVCEWLAKKYGYTRD